MDFLSEGFLCKAKSIVSSICGIMLWASRLSFPMQTPKEFPAHQRLQLGLKALIFSENLNYHSCIIHSYMILSSSSSSPSSTSSSSSSLFRSMSRSSLSSSWSSMVGDLIGTESGVYTSSNEDDKIEPYKCSGSKRNQRCETKREYPPTIPLLARTGNLPGHMPWVLTRHYIDGKLILKEERVKRHEYFEAHRVKGRLILNLIPLDDTIRCCHTVCENQNETEGNETEVDDDDGYNDIVKNSDDDSDDHEDDGYGKLHNVVDREVVQKTTSMTILASNSMPKSCRENRSERNGDIRKCFTYAGTEISDSNFFGIPIPMNRPVQT